MVSDRLKGARRAAGEQAMRELRIMGLIERKRGSGRGWESLHAGRAPAVL